MNLIEPYEGPPDKERLIAAMRGEPTDRVPNFEILIEDQHVERLLGRPAGNTLGVGGDRAKGLHGHPQDQGPSTVAVQPPFHLAGTRATDSIPHRPPGDKLANQRGEGANRRRKPACSK
jgi:hypothetical protein